MEFTLTKEKNIITVTVKLPLLVRNKETGLDINRTVLRENHVKDYLRKENIATGKCIQRNNLDNMGDNLVAVWKYEKPEEKKVDKAPPPVVSSTKAKKTRKTRKTRARKGLQFEEWSSKLKDE